MNAARLTMNHEQRDLFKPNDIERKFDEFDAENPEFWNLFEYFSLDVIARGGDRFSARDIFALIRWTPSGRVQVRLRADYAGRPCGAFYAVPVFQLQPRGGEDLAATLAALPS